MQQLLSFAEAVAIVVDGHTDEIEFCREKLALPAEQLNPEPLITGDDLIAAGIPPGPDFKRMLDAVRDAQLAGEISDCDTAIRLAKSLTE